MTQVFEKAKIQSLQSRKMSEDEPTSSPRLVKLRAFHYTEPKIQKPRTSIQPSSAQPTQAETSSIEEKENNEICHKFIHPLLNSA
jgi:hypothetical protein